MQTGPALSECNESKGFAHIFALVGVLVLFFVAAEVFYFSKAKPVRETQKASTPVAVSEATSKRQEPKASPLLQIPPLTTDTAAKQPEFNDYTNAGLGFKFNYDKDLSVRVDSEVEFNKRGGGDFRKNFQGYVGYEPGKSIGAVVVLDQTNDFDKNPLSVWVFENSGNLSVEKWFDEYWYYPFIWGVFDYVSKSHITLDREASVSGQPAKYKLISYQPGTPKFIYVAKADKIYLFRIIGETGDIILDTFKWVN